VVAVLKEAEEQLTRPRTVTIADADGAEQNGEFGMQRKIAPNSLPQCEQRPVLALVFRTHKRPAKFQRRTELIEQLCVVAEERAGIQTRHAHAWQNLGREANAIGANQFRLRAAPK